jgi:hypothetical protein
MTLTAVMFLLGAATAWRVAERWLAWKLQAFASRHDPRDPLV